MKDNNKIIEKRDYEFDGDKVKKIINEFYNTFKERKSTIEKAIEADLKVERIKLDYSVMLKQIEAIKNIEVNIFNKTLSKTIKTGIGNVGVLYGGCSYVTIDLILKALLTHNDIYLFSSDYMLATNTVIITILKDIIAKHKYEAKVKHLKASTSLFREASKYQNEFDLIVFVGPKHDYARVKKDFNKPLMFKQYEEVYVYADSEEEFKNTLSKMDRYAYDNAIHIQYLKGEELDKYIEKINETNKNDIIAIFTKNSKKAYEIVYKVNSKKICINKNPFENYIFNFDEELLVIEKELIY